MLTDKKIETAIKSFSIACMNNVKWKRVCTKLAQLISNRSIHVLGKAVWSDRETRINFRLDQVTDIGISDPGIFGNDREEYKQIEYLKIVQSLSDQIAVSNFETWCNQQRIELVLSNNELTIYGYKK